MLLAQRHRLMCSLMCSIVAVLFITTGCGTASGSPKGTLLHTVKVGPDVQPLQINAGKNDEVRWVNERSQRVAVIFPKSDEARISCRTGFRSLDNVLSADIAPHASASMCFSEPGKYDYVVRLDENLAAAETDRNASVWIGGGGYRNPGPVEQFENIRP